MDMYAYLVRCMLFLSGRDADSPDARSGNRSFRRERGLLFGTCAFLFFALGAQIFLPAATGAQTPCSEEIAGYTPALEGVADETLAQLLRDVSDSFSLVDSPPPSYDLLLERADRDIRNFERALESRGYFQGRAGYVLDRSVTPPELRFQVAPGERFPVSRLDVVLTPPGAAEAVSLPLKDLPLRPGEPYSSNRVLGTQKQILDLLTRKGHPFARIERREVVADHAAGTVSVTFVVEIGPAARFGETTFLGLRDVDESFLRNKIPWQPGQSFDASLIDVFRETLSATGLFSSIRITTGDEDQAMALPVTVTLAERAHRTIRAGVSYSTDEGLGAKASWEHRNIFSESEKLTMTGLVNEIRWLVQARYSDQEFFTPGHSLDLVTGIGEEYTDAYTSRKSENSAIVGKEFSDTFRASAGMGFDLVRVSDFNNPESFALLSLPLFGIYSTSDSLLDPTEGVRLSLESVPFQDIYEDRLFFWKNKATLAHYIGLWRDKVVLAGKATYERIDGSALFDVPADYRIYAGGGGSIRGYRYQFCGDLIDDTPTGGLSSLVINLESRLRLTERFGLVLFLDGGRSYQSAEFDEWKEPFFWGAGAGLRLFTPLGPVRFDLAFPLRYRSGVDDSYQLYISIGQAF